MGTKLLGCDLLELLPSLDVALGCCTAHLDHLGVYWSQLANRLPNLSHDGKWADGGCR